MRFSVRSFGCALFYFMEAKRNKKTISILLVLVMALSLCACGNNALSSAEKKVVGEWKPTDPDYSDSTLVFFDSGKCIFVSDESGWGTEYEWEVQNGKLYILDYGSSIAAGLRTMYTIKGKSLINPEGDVDFTKE